jgi:hypothetical protein
VPRGRAIDRWRRASSRSFRWRLLVRLHVVRTGLSPVRHAVSDYGTTPWHALYRAQAVALGAAGLALAIGLAGDRLG